MKAASQTLLNAISGTKTINARATFRQTRPLFAQTNMSPNVNITDPSRIDSCGLNGGILRAANVSNVLWTQFIPDVTGTWPSWVNTGIALYAGSHPGVDDGYVWYHKADNSICYRGYGSWNTEVVG